jgi:hypothetical protein
MEACYSELVLRAYRPNIYCVSEGLQSILIDWQGGFVGSVANDLMWSIFPFLEANQNKKVKLIYSFEKGNKIFEKKSQSYLSGISKKMEKFVQICVAFS